MERQDGEQMQDADTAFFVNVGTLLDFWLNPEIKTSADSFGVFPTENGDFVLGDYNGEDGFISLAELMESAEKKYPSFDAHQLVLNITINAEKTQMCWHMIPLH